MAYIKFFILFFLCIFKFIFSVALISCPNHAYELGLIRANVEESLYKSHKEGGKLFNDSMLMSVKDIIQFQLRYANKYSDYAVHFDDFLRYCDQAGKPTLYLGKTKMTEMFSEMYSKCISTHFNMTSRYQLGKIYFDQGMYDKCYVEIQAVIDAGVLNSGKVDKKNAIALELIKANVEIEDGQYDEAINTLTNLINKDPTNKEAYFSRAHAYFEKGLFDASLIDYIQSEKAKTVSNISPQTSSDFTNSLFEGVVEGGIDAAAEFVPSLCDTAYGMGECLWSFVQEPIDCTANFSNACYEAGSSVVEYVKTLDREKVDDLVDEVKELYQKFDVLNERQKGKLIGYCVGKYGVNIFVGGATVKCATAVNNLKNANKLANFECLAKSKGSFDKLKASALKHSEDRANYFQNSKLNIDKQNKHIVGKHNFEFGKSVFEHSHPEKLLKDFAGKGRALTHESPGLGQYKEIVDFKQHIGFWKNKEGSQFLPTTKGTIHYSKSGAHIVPAHPDTRVLK